jgi:2-dehydro-3-deoxyphosphogluconate aldolase/(4S)-4-hydroxy-2-oxoglutarate aldolase
MVAYVTDVRHSEHDVVDLIGITRLLPVVVLDDAKVAPLLAGALVAGGLRTVEITFRTSGAAAAISAVADRGDLLVGAGTVVTADQVDRAVDAGARFVVSPGFGPSVVRRCQQLGVPVFPGVATAAEIQMALDAGLSVVKFFPADSSPRNRWAGPQCSRRWPRRSARCGSSRPVG